MQLADIRLMQIQELNEQQLHKLLVFRKEQQKQDLTTEQRLVVASDIHNIKYQLWLYDSKQI